MAIQFQSNLASLSAQRVMFQNIRSQSDVLQQLSTGLRINSADDDAAGLAISERLNSQIRGNKKASENIQDAYNMLSTVDGFLSQVGDILQRQNELAVQAKNGTNGIEQLYALQREWNSNADEIDRMAESFRYNNLLAFQRIGFMNPSDQTFSIQAGHSGTNRDLLDLSDVMFLKGYMDELGLTAFLNQDNGTFTSYGKTRAGGYLRILQDGENPDYNPDAELGVTHHSSADFTTLQSIQAGISLLSGLRGQIGAHLNRFETALNNLNVQIENQTAAMARYTNTDFAKASIDFTRTQILQQSAAAVLTQANQNQNIALQLIQN